MAISRCRNTNPIIVGGGGDPNAGKYGYIGSAPVQDNILLWAFFKSIQRILQVSQVDGQPLHLFPSTTETQGAWGGSGSFGTPQLIVYDDGVCVFLDGEDPPDNIEVYE